MEEIQVKDQIRLVLQAIKMNNNFQFKILDALIDIKNTLKKMEAKK